jgi:hypothetical protein
MAIPFRELNIDYETMTTRYPTFRANWIIRSVAALFLCGCGFGEPYPMVRVSGKVSYDDGSLIPAERINVQFVPQAAPIDAKTHPRAGAAEVDPATGAFDLVTTHDYGDGVVAGRHRVLITAYGADNLPTAAIPERYRDPQQSPLVVDTDDAPFHLKIPLPSH